MSNDKMYNFTIYNFILSLVILFLAIMSLYILSVYRMHKLFNNIKKLFNNTTGPSASLCPTSLPSGFSATDSSRRRHWPKCPSWRRPWEVTAPRPTRVVARRERTRRNSWRRWLPTTTICLYPCTWRALCHFSPSKAMFLICVNVLILFTYVLDKYM